METVEQKPAIRRIEWQDLIPVAQKVRRIKTTIRAQILAEDMPLMPEFTD